MNIAAKRPVLMITAFEPFGEDVINSSEVILDMLPDIIDDIIIHRLLLPVEYKRAVELAITEYDKTLPSAVIMLGQAGGRSAISLEIVGRNLMNARIPDNVGYMPEHVPVIQDGPGTLSATLPAGRIREVLQNLKIPCEISDNAGEYVCNTLLYSMLAHNKGAVPTGFIHIPFLKEQGHEDQPFMETEDIYKGVVTVIEILRDYEFKVQ